MKDNRSAILPAPPTPKKKDKLMDEKKFPLLTPNIYDEDDLNNPKNIDVQKVLEIARKSRLSGIVSNSKPSNKGKAHLYISLIKSLIRILGCIIGIYLSGLNSPLGLVSALFLGAELLGIAEEIWDKR